VLLNTDLLVSYSY